jgi:hypothetical protein
MPSKALRMATTRLLKSFVVIRSSVRRTAMLSMAASVCLACASGTAWWSLISLRSRGMNDPSSRSSITRA